MTRSFTRMVGRGMPSGISDGKSRLQLVDGVILSTVANVGTAYHVPFASNLTIPLREANVMHLSVSGDCALDVPSESFTGDWKIYLRQDAAGGHKVTFGSNLHPVFNSSVNETADSVTLLSIVGRGDGKYDYTLMAVVSD